MGNEVDVDVAKLEAWMMEVENEFVLVGEVLQRVSELTTTVPGEDDTFIMTIYNYGTKVQQQWDNLKTIFKNASEEMKEVVQERKTKGQKAIEMIEEVASKFGL